MPDNIENKDWKPRQNVLTEADLDRLRQMLSEHPCKFSVTHEQMDRVVRLSEIFERIEKKVIDGITWAFIAIIGGILFLFYNHGMFKGTK
jgi:hypothetical protein